MPYRTAAMDTARSASNSARPGKDLAAIKRGSPAIPPAIHVFSGRGVIPHRRCSGMATVFIVVALSARERLSMYYFDRVQQIRFDSGADGTAGSTGEISEAASAKSGRKRMEQGQRPERVLRSR